MDRLDIISNLTQIRRSNKITQSDVAYNIGVTPLTLGRYERGIRDMPSSILVKYVEYLGYKLGVFKV